MRACATAPASRPRPCERVSNYMGRLRRQRAGLAARAAPAHPRRRSSRAGGRAPGAAQPRRRATSASSTTARSTCCSSTPAARRTVIARRVGMELGHIHPRPPAVRVFDAGMGDGTVLTRVMREMHRRFPTHAVLLRRQGDQPRGRAAVAGEDGGSLLRASGHRAGGHQHVLHRGALAHAEVGARRDLAAVARGRADRHDVARVQRADRRPRAVPRPRTGRRGTAPRPATRSTSGRWCW